MSSDRVWIAISVFFISLDVLVVATGGWGAWFYALLCAAWGVNIGLRLEEKS